MSLEDYTVQKPNPRLEVVVPLPNPKCIDCRRSEHCHSKGTDAGKELRLLTPEVQEFGKYQSRTLHVFV